MKGILVIAHGSRVSEVENIMDAVVEDLRMKWPETPIESAFMEFGNKTIRAGMAALVAAGVTKIIVSPYFLFAGTHLQKTIPTILSGCMRDYPHIELSMADPLGYDSRLCDILADRISSQKDA